MSNYHYQGHVPFLEAAARASGHAALAGRAGKSPALTALSNLCAQAVHAQEEQKAQILAEAEVLRDQLLLSYKTAELILADVRRGLGMTRSEPLAIEIEPAASAPGRRRCRRGSSGPGCGQR